ncbi:hypothetical protein POM88_029344 [Heracleum sosnowskyi]|uniref:Uncharacterized protein n=1 Tax=Heracleum sosnowskyi TaxID=360622 RepID=A0AAD8HUJ7_9APIA|nr:hypothetical protein POM88_029344 [Heracleum sosnowskyi]
MGSMEESLKEIIEIIGRGNKTSSASGRNLQFGKLNQSLNHSNFDQMSQAMANEATPEINFCLFFNFLHRDQRFEISFVRICVEPYSTEEELQNLSLLGLSGPPRPPRPPRPETTVPFIGKAVFPFKSSIASVGSMLFCLGGFILDQISNKVTKFNPSSPQFQLISCCNMIAARQSPSVISSAGILYVFGGLPYHTEEKKSTPWAEYLNTTLPENQQQWMPLDLPEDHFAHVSMISCLFVIPYNQAGTIFLIGFSRNLGINKSKSVGAILFDTTDMSFKEFNLIGMPLLTHVSNPVTIVEDRTMYWYHREYLHAYDFDNHVLYSALTSNSVLSHFGFRFSASRWGPLLGHLDKNLFCFFTLHCYGDSYSEALRILECTKFRATKVLDKSGKSGHLDLEPVGYQSYHCDVLRELSGVLPISLRG